MTKMNSSRKTYRMEALVIITLVAIINFYEHTCIVINPADAEEKSFKLFIVAD